MGKREPGGGAGEANTAGVGKGKKGSSCANLSNSLGDALSLNACSDLELAASSSNPFLCHSVEKFSCLLGRLCRRLWEIRPLEQRKNVAVSSL